MGEGTWTDVDAMGKDPDLMSTMGWELQLAGFLETETAMACK